MSNAEDDSLPGQTANPRVLAWFRVCVGVAAIVKGVALLFMDVTPTVVLPWMVLAICVAAGIAARKAAAAMIVIGVVLLLLAYRNHLYLLWLLLILVAVSDCERHYVVWKRRGAPPHAGGAVPGWPLFLMRCQASIVYFFAGLGKINPEFLDGRVLSFYLERAALPAPDLSSFVVPLAVLAVTAEIGLSAALWSERVRPWALGLVLPLHAGMLFFAASWTVVFNVSLFAFLMFTLFPAFLRLDEGGHLVVGGGTTAAERRAVALFRRLNAFGAIRFAGASEAGFYGESRDGRQTARLQCIRPDGAVDSGFDAVRTLLAVVPFGCLVAPWLALPGVRHAGDRLFGPAASRALSSGLP